MSPLRTARLVVGLLTAASSWTFADATAAQDGAPTLSIDSPRVAEGDSGSTSLTFTVTLAPAGDKTVTVPYADSRTGTATAGADYNALAPGTLTFAAGETSKIITVSVIGDTAAESDETVVVALGKADGAAVGTAAGTGTIADDDTVPALSIDSPRVNEGDAGMVNLTFTVTLAPASTKEVTVGYAEGAGGTATAGADYNALAPGTLTFAAGDARKTVTVSVIPDTKAESNETVVVTLSKPENATIARAAGTGTITDDDGARTVSIDSPSITEGDGGSRTLQYTVSLSGPSGRRVTVHYAEGAGGTATAGVDYTALAPGTLTFAAGETSKRIAVSVTGDTAIERNETIRVVLSNPTNATLGTATGIGTITDDEASPSLSIAGATVTEGTGGSTDLTFTVTLSAASSAGVTVDYATGTGGTAVSGTDYTAVSGTLTFAANDTTETISVPVTTDATDEDDETVTVILSNPVNATISTASGTGTITDDDAPPTVSIASARAAEGDSGSNDLEFTVSLGAASGREITVDYAEGTGGTAVSGTDYTAVSGTLTFAAGVTRRTITVATIGDTTDEPNETVVVVLRNAVNASLGAAAATGTITDDDDPPTVTLSLSSGSISEASGTTAVSATLSHASSAATTIAIPARSLAWTVPADASITIPAGATANSADTVTLTAMDNTSDEPDRRYTVTGSASNAVGAGAVTGAALTITDDDASPGGSCASGGVDLQFAVSRGTIDENGGTATVTVQALAPDLAVVQVLFSFSGATRGTHFTVTGSGTAQSGGGWLLGAPGGATRTTSTFTITARDNNDFETRTLRMNVAVLNVAGCSFPAQQIVIRDDDAALVTSAVSGQATEAGGAATFTVRLASRPTASVSVALSSTDSGEGTVSPTNLTFTSTNWNSPRTVTVTGVDDDFHDGDRRYAVRLGRPATTDVGYGRLGPREVSVSTTDDESPPRVTLSVSPGSVSENGGTARVSATLGVASEAATTITISPVSGAYTVGSDATITIPAGATANAADTVTVTAVDNGADEVDRTPIVTGTASNPLGVGAVTGAVLTLTDDDGAPTVILSVSPARISEAGGWATIRAALSSAFSSDVEVAVSGLLGVYGVPDTAIVIRAGSTTSENTLTLTASNNPTDAPDRTLAVSGRARYTTGSGTAATAAVRPASLTIVDDDLPSGSSPIFINTRGHRTSESSAGTGTTFAIGFEVILSHPARGEGVTVDYAVTSGTATAGQDYRAGRDFANVLRGGSTVLGGTLTFAAGEQQKWIYLEGLKDGVTEPVETVVVGLSNATNASDRTGDDPLDDFGRRAAAVPDDLSGASVHRRRRRHAVLG